MTTSQNDDLERVDLSPRQSIHQLLPYMDIFCDKSRSIPEAPTSDHPNPIPEEIKYHIWTQQPSIGSRIEVVRQLLPYTDTATLDRFPRLLESVPKSTRIHADSRLFKRHPTQSPPQTPRIRTEATPRAYRTCGGGRNDCRLLREEEPIGERIDAL
jgi:hypothetical protein